MKAWHFVADTLRDGSPIPYDGVMLKFDGEPILCEQGLHASLLPFDALHHAPGGTLCLVECGGVVVHGDDKLVCTERTILARMNSGPLMRHFSRMQALSVAHLWDPPEVVLDYLMTGDESIRAAARDAARDAAWDAACYAARGAARGAACDAAWAAARDAAWDAAWDAARAAARAAAWDAARDAACDAAWDEFNNLVFECFSDFLEAA